MMGSTERNNGKLYELLMPDLSGKTQKVLDEAKKAFPVTYEYDAWEMPETNKGKEKKLCEVLVWFQKYFGASN